MRRRRSNRSASGLGRALSQISGWATYGVGTKATLYIGRKAGLNLSGYREGEGISASTVEKTVLGYRAAQVGRAAGATTIAARGVYQGGREPTAVVEVVWVPNEYERTRPRFEKNVRELAQAVAHDLAQREVLVEWAAPGKKRGRIDTATPTDAPPATSRAFCAWVRRHSHAGERPSDACYEAPKKAKRRRRRAS